MSIQISLGSLGIMLLGFFLLVLIIYAILLLKNLTDTVKVLKKILQDNQSNIKQLLDQAPSIAQNIETISSDLSHDVKAVQSTFDNVIGTTEIAAATLTKNTDILSNIIGIVQSISSIKAFFHNLSLKNSFKKGKIS